MLSLPGAIFNARFWVPVPVLRSCTGLGGNLKNDMLAKGHPVYTFVKRFETYVSQSYGSWNQIKIILVRIQLGSRPYLDSKFPNLS